MAELKYWQAINQALHEEMTRDEAVVVAGIDVAEPGGPFGATRGLLERYGPVRVRDTPISEAAIAGLGVGAAMSGLRPVVEIMFFDFIALALEQLVNQGAKYRYMSNGMLKVPLTVRTLAGTRRNSGPQHSQSLEAWLGHVPGLKVVWPSTPADAKGLLKAAIRDDNPVVVIESLALWTSKGEVDGDKVIEIGVADTKRAGTDVTVVTIGSMVPLVLKCAGELSDEGIDVEVIDLRSVSPIDYEAVFRSVARTGRLVVAHDAVKPFGIGAEIAAAVSEHVFDELRAPIKRVASPWAPVSTAAGDDAAYYPDVQQIKSAIRAVM